MKTLSDIGLIGLAVMGENLILNMASKGYTVTAYNRSTDKVDAFIRGRASGRSIRGAWSVAELVQSLSSPQDHVDGKDDDARIPCTANKLMHMI